MLLSLHARTERRPGACLHDLVVAFSEETQLYGVEGLPEHVKSLVRRCISERIASAAENSGLRNSLVQLSGDFADSTASLLDVRACRGAGA